MDAQIFIPTCARDLDWLNVCLQSIRKYWSSDYKPIIVADKDCLGKIEESPRFIFEYVDRWSDGHRDQVHLKMMADMYVKSEMILYMDSDCMFTEACCAGDFMDLKLRPIIHVREFSEIFKRNLNHSERTSYEGYHRTLKEILAIDCEWEYMQRHPFLYYTDTITHTRETMEQNMGMPLDKISEKYHSWHFSEFNFFGAWAHKYEYDRYDFRLPGGWDPPRMRQFHSWTQSPDSEREEIKQILSPA